MTRVAPVGSLAVAAPTAVRKSAAKAPTNDPFADALMDLLAAVPQPAPKTPTTPAKAAVVVGADDTASGQDSAAVDPAALPALLQAAAPPVDPHPSTAQDVAGDFETPPARPTRLALAASAGSATPADAVVPAAVGEGATQGDDVAAAPAKPAAAVATPEATAAAIQAAAALALALGAGAVVAPATGPKPGHGDAAGSAPSPIPAPAAPSGADVVPTAAGTIDASDPASLMAAAGAGGDPATRSLFSAALLSLEARWSPPTATELRTASRSVSTEPTSDDGGGDPAAGAADGSSTLGDANPAPAATPPPPPPAALAQLLADAVRHASASTDSTPAASPAAHSRHDGGGDDAASTPAAAPAALPVGAPQPAAALAAAPAAPLLNGTPVATASLDPGPRQAPEPKAAPAPTAHATLELDVDKTGASRIRIAVQGSQVRATITASEIGAASLDRQLPELRRSLEERGFSDVRLTVHTQDQSVAAPANANAADDTQSFSRNPSNQQSQRWAQQQDTGDGAGSQRRRREKEEQA